MQGFPYFNHYLGLPCHCEAGAAGRGNLVDLREYNAIATRPRGVRNDALSISIGNIRGIESPKTVCYK